jgi:hypothetical protein
MTYYYFTDGMSKEHADSRRTGILPQVMVKCTYQNINVRLEYNVGNTQQLIMKITPEIIAIEQFERS